MELGSGSQLGDLTLLREIGRGGMGVVFEAEGPSGACAVKVIPPALARRKSIVAMLREEYRIASNIHHPNVVRMSEMRDEPSPHVIMDLVLGTDLARLLSGLVRIGDRLTVGAAASVAIQSARGLRAAHAASDEHGHVLDVVHRDVTPSNLLIAPSGAVKVTDFGVARARQRLFETSTGVVKGKFAYMSPEQARGESVGPLSDVFSLAIVLWETLAMRRLNTGGTDAEMIILARRGRYPTLLGAGAPVSAEISNLVHAGLCPEASDRISMAEWEAEWTRLVGLDIESSVALSDCVQRVHETGPTGLMDTGAAI